MDLKEIGISTENYADSAHVRDYWRALVNIQAIIPKLVFATYQWKKEHNNDLIPNPRMCVDVSIWFFRAFQG